MRTYVQNPIKIQFSETYISNILQSKILLVYITYLMGTISSNFHNNVFST